MGGWLELHVECVEAELPAHLGQHEGPVSWSALALLGFRAVAEYRELPLGRRLPRLRSKAGLPHNACEAIMRRAGELAGGDGGQWRFIEFVELMSAKCWKQSSDGQFVYAAHNVAKLDRDGEECMF